MNYKLGHERRINAEGILEQIRILMGNLFNKAIGPILFAFGIEVLVYHAGPIGNDVVDIHVVDKMIYVSVDKLLAEGLISIEFVGKVVDVDGCHKLVKDSPW
jgi:hypothetical protein